MAENSDLKVIAFNCSLKSADEAKETSSTEKLVNQLLEEFKKHDATGTIVRAVDHDIKPGVTSDEGDGDEWPASSMKRKIVLDVRGIARSFSCWWHLATSSGQRLAATARISSEIDAPSVASRTMR